MNKIREKMSPYKIKIKIAISALKMGDYELALISTKQAGLENQDLPEYHNLLGIIAEHHMDHCLACKHYRAAYALDPTYKPALNNLNRIANQSGGNLPKAPDYGDNFEMEVVSQSLFFLDLLNGNRKKKSEERVDLNVYYNNWLWKTR